MKTSTKQTIPTLEWDSAANAAYIRFSRDKVQRTVKAKHCVVNMDVAADGSVIGVELLTWGRKTEGPSNAS